MPEQSGLIVDFVLVLAAALIGGALAQWLRQPLILGYLIAGVALGPALPGPVVDPGQVQVLAEFGVALLMFTLGAEFSLAHLQSVRRVAIFGGSAQILLTIGLGFGLGAALGLAPLPALFFGAIVALSSTIVALRLLTDRGELGSLHGRIATGILLVQDLSVVPMVVILPALAGPGEAIVPGLLLAAAKATLILAATYYLGTRWVPRLLFQVAATQSRELFVLTTVTLALGAALITLAAGLSLAFGAFLAGLIISESEFHSEMLGQVLPLRNVFATLFFVSVGMLFNPVFVAANLGAVALVVLTVLVGKFLIGLAVPLAFGYPGRTAVYVGLSILQIGEFSFVLARVGVERGVISDYLYSFTLAVALLTMLVSPLALGLGPQVLTGLRALPAIGRLLEERAVDFVPGGSEELVRHVVICGFGRIGRELATALERRGFRYVVIEYDPHVVEDLRRRKTACIYGDAGNPIVLERANLARAVALVVAVPDPLAAKLAIQHARRLNPRLDIIARADSEQVARELRAAGANEVVRPQVEAGLEFIRHTLQRYGVTGPELAALVAGRRAAYREE